MNRTISIITLGILVISCGCTGSRNPAVPPEEIDPSTCIIQVETISDPGGRVSWHPDQNVIAFDRAGTDGYLDIYVIHLDGTGATCLTNTDPRLSHHNGNPSWHPSGRYLVFQSQNPDLEIETPIDMSPDMEKFITSPGIGIHNNLWIMTSDGTQRWQMTHVEKNHGALHPHFSPDGTALLWTEIINPELGGMGHWAIRLADFTVDENGPFLSNIQTIRPLDLQLYEVHGFSPDGMSILFSGVESGGYYYDMEIYLMDLTTHTVKRLTHNDEWDEHAHFTPDGSHIVWVSSEGIAQRKGKTLIEIIENPPRLEYWIMDPDGTQKQRLSYFNDPFSPGFRDVSGGIGLGDFDIHPLEFKIVAKMREGTQRELTVLLLFSHECTSTHS